MANLIIQENGVARTRPAVTGEEITIKTPCGCSDVTGVQINGVAFPFYDAMGNSLANTTGLFNRNSLIRVLIDADAKRAYILNADTNAYLEGELAKKLSLSGGSMKGQLNFLSNQSYTNVFTNVYGAVIQSNLIGAADYTGIRVHGDTLKITHHTYTKDDGHIEHEILDEGNAASIIQSLIDAGSINAGAKIASGSYAGVGSASTSRPNKILNVGFPIKFINIIVDDRLNVIIHPQAGFGVFYYRNSSGSSSTAGCGTFTVTVHEDNSVELPAYVNDNYAIITLNEKGTTYHYVAIG